MFLCHYKSFFISQLVYTKSWTWWSKS